MGYYFTLSTLLESKTALVTGSSKGVGKGIALELARCGCDVAINYHSDADGAAATVAEIRAMGRNAFAVTANVGVATEVDRMFGEVFERFTLLDILVNNAGVQTWKPLLDLEESEWDRTIQTNLKGCFLCTQRAARRMREHRSGRIVNIGSGCNKIPFPNLVDYTASKDEAGGRRLLLHLGANHAARPRGAAAGHRARGSVPGERRRGVHHRSNHLGRWRALHSSDLAIPVVSGCAGGVRLALGVLLRMS
jgi:enoyl-[acyl-carrier-protein] reductase (NADH)